MPCKILQAMQAVEALREVAPADTDAIALHILLLEACKQDTETQQSLRKVGLEHSTKHALL